MLHQGKLLFFRPDFFPYQLVLKPNKKNPEPVFTVHIPEETVLQLGEHRFGPWVVTLTVRMWLRCE